MKKIIYCTFASFFILSLSDCNDGGVGKKQDSDSLKNNQVSKRDTGDDELVEFLHLKPRKKSPSSVYDEDVWTPELKPVFDGDYKTFVNKYLSGLNPLLIKSSYFSFGVYELYHILQNRLGLKSIQEVGTNKYNEVRIYPAIEVNNGQKELYLVLFGEKVTFNPRYYKTMLDTFAYTIRGDVFSEISHKSGEYTQLRTEILEFQNFWMANESIATRDDINRNMCFSIAEYYEVLKQLDPSLNMINDTSKATGRYKMVFYPCLGNDKKLRFVAKGKIDNLVLDNMDFYNNMDVCPKRCPANELQ